MNQQEIGKFISICRKEKELTQTQLAEILGVSDKSISRWENGKTMPDSEKSIQGDKSALSIFKTKSQLETFGIFTEILIVIGIIITVTLTKLLTYTVTQAIVTIICGCFVWGFGLILKVKIRKAIIELKKQ